MFVLTSWHKLQNGSNLSKLAPTQSSPPLTKTETQQKSDSKPKYLSGHRQMILENKYNKGTEIIMIWKKNRESTE